MILDELLKATRSALPERKAQLPLAQLERQIKESPPPRNLLPALVQPGVSIIAEIKRASPSRGALNSALDPVTQATSYARAGAAAISVLTEPTRFKGSLQDLALVRQTVDAVCPDLPLLCKDFIVDDYQVYAARASGADLVLLIAAALTNDELCRLYQTICGLGMLPLVEVHNEAELQRALVLAPPLVGINNRDLHTFQVDLATTMRLLPLVPAGTLVVSESGIRSVGEMRQLAERRVAGALIGEALVTAPDPAVLLAELLEAGRWLR